MFQRISGAGSNPATEAVDVAAFARGVVESSRSYLEERGHEVTISLPSAPLFAEADPVRLEQILSNLLNNAAKYTDPGGQIRSTISAGRPAGGRASKTTAWASQRNYSPVSSTCSRKGRGRWTGRWEALASA